MLTIAVAQTHPRSLETNANYENALELIAVCGGYAEVGDPAAANGEYLLFFSETEAAVKSIEIDPTAADNKALNQFNTLFEDRRPEMYSL